MVVCLLLHVVINSTTAFSTPKTNRAGTAVNSRSHSSKSSSLFYRSFPHDDDDGNNSKSSSTANSSDKAQFERVSSIAGVSVSSDGFQVVLETATSQKYITLPVTSSSEDEHATTTPESLTIIQLINGVDMAGTMLPPDILARMVVLHCEEQAQDEQDAWLEQLVDDDHNDHDEDEPFVTHLSAVQQGVLSFIQNSLCDFQSSSQYSSSSSASSKTLSSYTDSHSWVQNKLKLPTTTLDQLKVMIEVVEDEESGSAKSIKITDVILECAVYGVGSISFSPSEFVTSQVLYSYDPSNEGQISKSFLSIALALRYKAPIVLEYSYAASSTSSSSNEKNTNSDTKNDEEEDHSAISAYSVATPRSSNAKYSDNDDDNSRHTVYLWDSLDEMSQTYPKWTTVQNLQSSSTRVTQNIERGFEIQKLSGALRIAMERGDQKAVDAIREKLDEYDSMNDLPTTADKSCSDNKSKASGSDATNAADPKLSYFSSVDGTDEDNNILQ